MPDLLRALLYWTAVLVISLALVVGLILFFESRDESSLGEDATAPTDAGAGRALARS